MEAAPIGVASDCPLGRLVKEHFTNLLAILSVEVVSNCRAVVLKHERLKGQR